MTNEQSRSKPCGERSISTISARGNAAVGGRSKAATCSVLAEGQTAARTASPEVGSRA